jgi:hypothetical protein
MPPRGNASAPKGHQATAIDFRGCPKNLFEHRVTWGESRTSVKQDHSGAGSDHHNATDRQLSAL